MWNLFKTNNENTRTTSSFCFSLILDRSHILFWYFHCWLWTSKCRLTQSMKSSTWPQQIQNNFYIKAINLMRYNFVRMIVEYKTIVHRTHHPFNPPQFFFGGGLDMLLHMFIIWISARVLLGFFQGDVSAKY